MSNSSYETFLELYKSGKEVAPYLHQHINDFNLRIHLELDFMRDLPHKYMYLITPKKVARDLRELVYYYHSEEKTDLLNTIKNKSKTIKHELMHIPHILTDIDDTLFPSANGIIQTSGSDTSWKNGQPYPGIKKLYELFYKNIPVGEARYSTVLTGTPAFLKGHRIEDPKIKEAIGPKFGFLQGFESKREALYSLMKGIYEQPFYKLAVSNNDLAKIKVERFKQYKQLFPEYTLIFIGDNGQGDFIAGKQLITEDPTCYVFIHNLFRDGKFLFDSETTHYHTSDRLFFFKNYLELGHKFYKLGYIKRNDFDLLRISIAEELRKNKAYDPNGHHYFHYMRRKTLKIKHH
jgi:hypothetical protein